MQQSSVHQQSIALRHIDIASPCTASWDKMKGDDRVRHCNDCNKNVFNLSDMPQADAAALLADNHDGNLCVRFYRRQDGTVMTSDCGDSPRAAVRQAWRKLPFMAGAAMLALSAAGCAVSDPVPVSTVDAPAPIVPPPPMMVMMGAPPPTMRDVADDAKPAGQGGQQAKDAKPVEWLGNAAAPRQPVKQANKSARRRAR
ncbi:hypothetical protein [Massilia antarctica]|uniref:hypothetical protein n=1 Tax=Massilia antarctica TaxID=2765360 RepID=UPI0006BB854E|nr:hypothetical protein [Massilia sp. H27-R4]MCY0912785.1 hypothetical protein [Massilia sp. H27-R4]CUI03863.1 hypothetical protein BN2497_2503 [Janthinobacterium sp. CG23_2]CUU27649.1 hypothetical protein BN3177_2503 [Janthinobacterium sp. CG23_2]